MKRDGRKGAEKRGARPRRRAAAWHHKPHVKRAEEGQRGCVCVPAFAFISSARRERREGEEERLQASQHGKQCLALSWVCPVHFTLSDLTPSLLPMPLMVAVSGGCAWQERWAWFGHKQDLATRLTHAHSPHQHYHHYTHTGHSTTSSSMSRMIRKGLDTLGKALRETGQALDRAGLEALGTDKHKELCKCRQMAHVCGMNACPCPLINTSV